MYQVKGRQNTTECSTKPHENSGQEDTDPGREDAGELEGTVGTQAE